MQDLQSIYIIDQNGIPFFVRDMYVQGSEDADHALLTNFISAIQNFAEELGGEEAKTIKLGEAKIYSVKDKMTKIAFVIKANPKAKDKKVFSLLNTIKNTFIDIFTGKFTVGSEEKEILLDKFRQELDKIVNPIDKVSSFLGSI